MSPNMKLTVLAFAGAAAAVPGFGHGHGYAHKHFTPAAGTAGGAYPTGGWGHGYNASSPAVPQGTGTGIKSEPAAEKTTTFDSGYTITSTLTSTVTLTRSSSSVVPSNVAAKEVSSQAPLCGQTVYVTQTDRITVTVPAGGYSASSSVASSSAAPKASSPEPGYEAAKPSAPAQKPSSPVAPIAAPSKPAEYQVPTSFVLASSVESKAQETPTSVAAIAKPSPSADAVHSSSSSSAAPANSAPPSTGYTGGKRGLAYRWDGAADAKTFENNNFGFVWNWEADTRGDIGKLAANFIPTLRTLANAADWKVKAHAAIDAGSKVLFGFNEPDIASQANLGYAALCDAWKANMNPFHGKATIVGPSVSSSQNPDQGLDFLSKFAERCPGASFDDVNIHWYGPPSAGVTAFSAHYADAKARFPGRKIWVTEFGLTAASPQESADFLAAAQRFLDAESSCAGYSYFAVGNWDASANLLGTAKNLTPAGKVYVS